MSGPGLEGWFGVGERGLYVEAYGTGAPTVVIETGSTMAGTSDAGWVGIREALAAQTRVFLYDRANLGRSDPAPLPRLLSEFTGDLRGALEAAKVGPPYMLVGCSFGGMIVTHFASLYPGDVAGIVLLDPPHPEIDLRTLAVLAEETPGEPPALANFRRQAWLEHFRPLETFEWEGLDAPRSIAEAKAWDLGSIPLAVFTAGMNEYEEGMPEEAIRAYEAEWMACQRVYVGLSARSTHLVVEDCDHVIHEGRPELVLEAVRAMVRNLTRRTRGRGV